MLNINEIISKYISDNFSPTEHERSEVSRRYNELAGLLVGQNFQSGSYARFTAITPIHDLDVIWVLPQELLSLTFNESLSKKIDSRDLDVDNLLHDLALKLASEYKKIDSGVKVTPQTHSVTIQFNNSDFTIDVVPAIPLAEENEFRDPIFIVPELFRISHSRRIKKYESHEPIAWVKTDPKGYIESAKQLNEVNESFRKATKFLKRWKDKLKAKDENIKFKSFHIEQIVHNILIANDHDLITTIKIFLNNVDTYINSAQIPDRADDDRFIDSYVNDLTYEQKHALSQNAKISANLITSLISETSEHSALNILNELCLDVKSNNSLVYPIIKTNVPTAPWCESN